MKSKNVGLKIFSFILCAIGALCVVYSLIMLNYNSKAILLSDAMAEDEGRYAYVDIIYIESFAERGREYTYYYGFDTNKSLYILNINDETYIDISTDFNDKGDNFHYILKGITYETPEDVKAKAIENFPKLNLEGVEIDENNYLDYFGPYMLDTEARFNYTNSYIAVGIGAVLCISSLVFIAILFKKRG